MGTGLAEGFPVGRPSLWPKGFGPSLRAGREPSPVSLPGGTPDRPKRPAFGRLAVSDRLIPMGTGLAEGFPVGRPSLWPKGFGPSLKNR